MSVQVQNTGIAYKLIDRKETEKLFYSIFAAIVWCESKNSRYMLQLEKITTKLALHEPTMTMRPAKVWKNGELMENVDMACFGAGRLLFSTSEGKDAGKSGALLEIREIIEA